MKKDGTAVSTDLNAYGAFAGSFLVKGAAVLAKGGKTEAPAFTMLGDNGGQLYDTQAQISFATLGGQLGAQNQDQGSNTGISSTGWKRDEFELLRSIVGAPAQFGLAARVKLVDPSSNVAASDGDTTASTFDIAAVNTTDGLLQNSLVVYGIRDRGTKTTQNGSTYSNMLGETGIEPGAPVLAQWWNTGNGNVAYTNFPLVIKAYATEWLPADEFTEVVAITHNFVSKVEYPGLADTAEVAKLYGQVGLIAPKGHSLLSTTDGVRPVVTPVRQLAINDLQSNYAPGSVAIGTKLDIFNGNAENNTTGAPFGSAPDYKLVDGNSTGTNDWTLNGNSTLQLTWQPAVNDLRHPSGYIVTLYYVGGSSSSTSLMTLAEYRTGHLGGIGELQTLNLPNLASIYGSRFNTQPSNGSFHSFAVKVRNVWMEGTEGAAGHSFDMGKEPWGTRFPMAFADVISGVFVGRF